MKANNSIKNSLVALEELFRRIICCVLVAVSLGVPVFAQTTSTKNDLETLRHLKEVEWPKAYREQDTKLLDSILADEFQMIDNAGNWSNKKKELEYIKGNRPSYDTFRFEIKRLEIFENGTAIIAGTGHIVSKDKDGPYRVEYQSSNILIKRNGTWKAISSHVSGIKRVAANSAIPGKKGFDHHVHLMSPRLIKVFKDVGIPFSKPDADYSDLSAIQKRLGTNRFRLVSMAYLYGHPEFGKVENEYDAVRAENDFLIETRNRSPKTVEAFCGINPLKDYALKEAERCHDTLKADGLKFHFGTAQVYLTVPEHLLKVKAMFEYAAKTKMPILLHFDNLHPKFGEPDVRLLANEILAKIDSVNLQIAHFGTSGGFNQRTKGVINAFIDQFESNSSIKKHRIMFDISAVALDKDSEGVSKLTDEQFADLAVHIRKLGIERIVFGTDYPLYSVDEYIAVLKDRVKLTDSEIATLVYRDQP